MKASHEKYYLSALGITILLLFFFSLEITIDSIKFIVDIPNSRFEPPADVKALIK